MTQALLLGAFGAVAGLALSRWLGGLHYRYADEQDRLARPTWWWLVPVMVVANVALGLRLQHRPLVVVITYAAALVVLATLMAIDIDVHRLPDVLTLPSYPVFAALLALCSWATGDWAAYRRALVCAVALFGAYLLLAVVSPGGGGLGFGDVKLAGVLGMLLGWFAWPLTLLATCAAFLLGGLFGLALLVLRRASRKTAIAFGPHMIVGAVAVLVASPTTVVGLLP